ncbi:uncharacterized protein CLUP02_09806 [Colletotrichum lupini]|uniref:Uncharacterized protein n=1 Tax=Colletotrichum lupini TaxID=145971 RepID=A0A9Q8SWC9_9PEZI|nr:uncharacterized protein CLUP02_09806 [Colletotrichum lupini]UQC84310.1 hypothetical protein CLUP02_09806 [Colletotrichum lupini]
MVPTDPALLDANTGDEEVLMISKMCEKASLTMDNKALVPLLSWDRCLGMAIWCWCLRGSETDKEFIENVKPFVLDPLKDTNVFPVRNSIQTILCSASTNITNMLAIPRHKATLATASDHKAALFFSLSLSLSVGAILLRRRPLGIQLGQHRVGSRGDRRFQGFMHDRSPMWAAWGGLAPGSERSPRLNEVFSCKQKAPRQVAEYYPSIMADSIQWTRVLQLVNLLGVTHLAGYQFGTDKIAMYSILKLNDKDTIVKLWFRGWDFGRVYGPAMVVGTAAVFGFLAWNDGIASPAFPFNLAAGLLMGAKSNSTAAYG